MQWPRIWPCGTPSIIVSYPSCEATCVVVGTSHLKNPLDGSQLLKILPPPDKVIKSKAKGNCKVRMMTTIVSTIFFFHFISFTKYEVICCALCQSNFVIYMTSVNFTYIYWSICKSFKIELKLEIWKQLSWKWYLQLTYIIQLYLGLSILHGNCVALPHCTPVRCYCITPCRVK